MKNVNVEILFKNTETDKIHKFEDSFIKSEFFQNRIDALCEKIITEYANQVNGKIVNES